MLSMAVLPVLLPAWWHSNRNKAMVSLVASIPVVALVFSCRPLLLMHALQDYVSFIVLLGALFVISGGIHIRGAWAGTPLVNTVYLAVGAVLANLVGTTGASMLLIRPYMRANHNRRDRSHLIIFLIFIVSNIAGLLTPLGDPPSLPRLSAWSSFPLDLEAVSSMGIRGRISFGAFQPNRSIYLQ